MTEELEALGRRAVACAGWRWMPGMLVAGHGGGVRFCWEDDDYMHGATEEGGSWIRLIKMKPRTPDLSDPATLGCIVALVQNVYNDPEISVFWVNARGSGWVVGHVEAWSDASAETVVDGMFGSAAEALVAALEAAP